MAANGMYPIHPGKILRGEFLMKLGISPAALTRTLKVSALTVNDIIREQRDISVGMAIRLGRCFGTSAQFWMSLQGRYPLAAAYAADGKQIEHETEPLLAHG